ncbi:response regulator transcription factor [Butyrivibrio sp. VCB2006]|uniref:response regulator transcription factor n=1 Tax=Butyrivibrio sp. VCB2006 TaxID=1280679 RepID=UPI0004094A58|nr:response regulator [Butyrivibrio sp. VCB2006]
MVDIGVQGRVMTKVFLVEDEFVVREGIKNNINWESHGYDFCGEASDGEVAYSMIQKEQPDIVITDIKMPFMDGLQLSRLIKAEFPWIEIILLTGYEDFQYAREAIRIGVSCYLSKPISGDNLLKEVDALAEKVEEKKQERKYALRYEAEMQERTEAIKHGISEIETFMADFYNGRYFPTQNPSSASEDEIIPEIDPKHIDRKYIKEFLRRGDESETEVYLDEFFKRIGRNAIKSTMLRQYVAMDVYFCVADFVENDLGAGRDKLDAKIAIPTPEIFAEENRTREYLAGAIRAAIEIRDNNYSGKYHDMVKESLAYIEEHYSEDELSLNTLAAHVNFSPNHLSAVFKQETGQPFIKYLTDFRMEKAKELLCTTAKKSNEIGLMVGYKDPHYFSYLFKKTQGVTTTQYRSGMQMEAAK